MDKIFDSEFYSKLHTLRMSIAMRLAAGMSGGRKSNAKGNSVEFSDFREYQLGDDIRRIDWNAYGRFDKLYIKLFMEEKEGIFQIFMDTSKSMDYGAAHKGVCALRIAAALSYVVLENSDRLYLNLMKEGKLECPKSYTGKQAFSKVIDYLENVKFDGAGDLLSSVHYKKFDRRGMSVLISDGYSEDLEDVFRYMKFKNQDIVFVHVLAPEERDPSFEGTVKLIDSETMGDMRMTMSASMLKSYKNSYRRFIRDTEILCKKYSAIYIPVSSDDSLDALLFGALAKISPRR
ncbi:MAG: DUF58 domain-containing protein [Lachnospiraceae bacterium]|nr:DUF58 domain-containing protein [Lachnospiraceae bacterium]